MIPVGPHTLSDKGTRMSDMLLFVMSRKRRRDLFAALSHCWLSNVAIESEPRTGLLPSIALLELGSRFNFRELVRGSPTSGEFTDPLLFQLVDSLDIFVAGML